MALVEQARDEFHCDAPAFRTFIAAVKEHLARTSDPVQLVRDLRVPFADLLADQAWLPPEFAVPSKDTGMGGGITSWLLYRSADRNVTFISLVVPPGSTTPVHDHLAWGLVGLYRGEQTEDVFERLDDGTAEGKAKLRLVEQRRLVPGDFYDLLPPDGDIHSVTSTSSEPSISLHLLGNDTGCVIRHAFDPSQDAVRAFKSGYANVECEETK